MRTRIKQTIQGAIGLAIGVFILWWMFQGTSWAGLKRSFAEIRWGWLVLAALFVLLRVIYIVLYVTNRASMRSAVWLLAMAVNIGILLAGYR